MPQLEKVFERKFTDHVSGEGDFCVKIERRHWPDRVIFGNNGMHFFIEFKREGEEPRTGQRILHRILRARGHRVYVCKSFKEAVEAYEIEKVRSQELSASVN